MNSNQLLALSVSAAEVETQFVSMHISGQFLISDPSSYGPANSPPLISQDSVINHIGQQAVESISMTSWMSISKGAHKRWEHG
jgi:hypothetical protein